MSPQERRQRRLAVAAHKLVVLSILRQQWGGGVLPLVDVSPTRKESK